MSDDPRWSRPVLVAVVTIAAAVALAGLAASAAAPSDDNAYALPQFCIGLSSVGVGAFVVWRRPRHPMGWLLVAAGLTAWMTFAGQAVIFWIIVNAPDREAVGRVLLHLATPGWIVSRGIFITLIPQAFPDGFGRSRPARLLLVASVASIGVTAVSQSRLFTFEYFSGEPPVGTAVLAEQLLPWGHRAMLLCGVVSIVGLVVRTVRAGAEARRLHRWFVATTVVVLLPILFGPFQEFVHSFDVELSGIEVWGMVALPVVLAVGILRHGLFEIDVVVRRATLYAGVSVVALAIYAAAVWAVTALSAGSASYAPVVGAGVVAVTLSQVRDGVQRLTSRHLFGNRDDPYATLAALGARVESAPLGDQALQTVTDTICEQLRVPYAAVDLVLEDTEVRVAETGRDVAGQATSIERFPLQHRGVVLGALLVGRRTSTESFTDGERRLLGDLARQTGVLAHNVSLTEALRRSRAVLLNAREEERRRIRADLHDGLGPTLATVALGLGAAADQLPTDAELTVLLTDLEQELQTAIADVRTLVYDLRPAALDDLGLVSALREHAENLARRTADSSRPLQVEIDAPPDLDQLPAGVEVAAYRVALEALTNVARHARASQCRIRIDTGRGLTIDVSDDGVGMPERAAVGMGLTSMRERVEELGGRFAVHGASPRGTTVRAWFPLPAGIAP